MTDTTGFRGQVFCRSMPGMPQEDPRCLAYYWNWCVSPSGWCSCLDLFEL